MPGYNARPNVHLKTTTIPNIQRLSCAQYSNHTARCDDRIDTGRDDIQENPGRLMKQVSEDGQNINGEKETAMQEQLQSLIERILLLEIKVKELEELVEEKSKCGVISLEGSVTRSALG